MCNGLRCESMSGEYRTASCSLEKPAVVGRLDLLRTGPELGVFVTACLVLSCPGVKF
jgi:hypothetical protein